MLSVATLTTLPTGRIESSAAAMPVRTCAPDAVVVPLQYAVAEKSRRAPGTGALGSTTRAAAPHGSRSNVVASYVTSSAPMTTTMTTRRCELERERIRFTGNARTLLEDPCRRSRCAERCECPWSRYQSGLSADRRPGSSPPSGAPETRDEL